MPSTDADRIRPRFARVAGVIALAAFAALAGLPLLVGSAPRKSAPADPDYPHDSFREDCGLCHRADAWVPARPSRSFDHERRSGFVLRGSHAAANCRGCHVNLDFSDRNHTRCASCHEDPHRGELGEDCARCHTSRSFIERGIMMRAHALTHFPLTGAHAGLDCEACHAMTAQGRQRFVGTDAACQSCHMPDYRAATGPPHLAAGFPVTCQTCHTPITWHSARFDHGATSFPLTGEHRSLACDRCHGDGVYRGKSTLCVSCHQGDYDRAASPPHGGFPTTCQDCHGTGGWEGANFDHSVTQFPLTGAHRTTACMDCHGDNVWNGKSTLCVSCHRSEYDATTNPAHAAAGFPTTCETCHGTVTWEGARFDHDTRNFPIYSGRHAGLWASCTTCHNVPQNYKAFTCFSCHPHDDRAKTDGDHQGRAGYSYDSQACYTCHPRGTH